MSVQSKAIGTLGVALGASMLHAAHWRRRAHAISNTEIEAATSAQLSMLMTADTTDGCGLAAYYLVEGNDPPVGDRRWYWWAAATCRVCFGVHEPWWGWAPTRRAGQGAINEALEIVTDPDNCTIADTA